MLKKIAILSLISFTLFSSFSCRKAEIAPEKESENKPINNIPEEDPLPKEVQDNNQPQANKFIELNILSYNVWGVPKIAGVYNVTKDQDERFGYIGDAINGFDIVNLQETFGDNVNLITDKASYLTKERLDNSSFLAYNAGLTTLSKYSIVKKDYIKFSECEGADCYSNKGVFFVRFNVPNFGEIDVYNTHYQASAKNENIRITDNREFEMLVKRNDVGNPTIMTGDFNFDNIDSTDSSSKSLLDFKKRFNPIDTYRLKNKSDNGFTSDNTNPYNSKKEKSKRLDYIFLLPENRGINNQKLKYSFEVLESKIVNNTPVNGKFMSDHFGLNTKLRINVF
ncbi:MAG: endonuclease/exonuclease/phosphatase family protein [Candidatus Sericytochromatia bacterium]